MDARFLGMGLDGSGRTIVSPVEQQSTSSSNYKFAENYAVDESISFIQSVWTKHMKFYV